MLALMLVSIIHMYLFNVLCVVVDSKGWLPWDNCKKCVLTCGKKAKVGNMDRPRP